MCTTIVCCINFVKHKHFFTIWCKDTMQRNARIGSKSILASHCISTSVNMKVTQCNDYEPALTVRCKYGDALHKGTGAVQILWFFLTSLYIFSVLNLNISLIQLTFLKMLLRVSHQSLSLGYTLAGLVWIKALFTRWSWVSGGTHNSKMRREAW